MKSKQLFENIINDLKSTLNLIESFNNLSNVSEIDIDLAMQKTRNIYDNIIKLKSNNDVSNEKFEEKIIVSQEKETTDFKEIKEEPVINDSKDLNIDNIDKPNKINNQTELFFESQENNESDNEILDFVEEEIEIENSNQETNDNKINSLDELNEFEEENTKKEDIKEDVIEEIDEVKELISETEKDIDTKITINELIARVDKSKGVGEKFTEAPIANIKAAISLNDKIWYINNLFDGKTEDYNKTIDTLNNFNNIDQALEFINNKFNFDNEKESLTSFLKLIYRRFINS